MRDRKLLDYTTPVILTFDEADNISRVLDRLSWAKDIVIVDSGSHDGTQDIIARYPSARIYTRAFDDHASQWNFAIKETDIQTEWVLALDADHVMTLDMVRELSGISPAFEISGYRVTFKYCVLGRQLSGSLYPPLISIFRRARAHYVQQGHTQRIVVDGRIGSLKSCLLHDDRKSLGRWLKAQNRYMRLEAALIRRSSWQQLSWPNRLRMFIVPAPIVTLLWCLLVKRAILDGVPGIYYSVQRMVAEFILSFHLIVRSHR
jgi:glycosyltransferase involved in cell wall biosynthesis